MLDIDDHHCKHCSRRIPNNRNFCYICDMVVNGNVVQTPKNIRELVDEFINDENLSDYEPEDVIALFDKFEAHVNNKKYRITIQ